MNTKKHLITLIVFFIGTTLIASTALAGSKQQHRWEGVAIGLGAAILGHAIYQAHRPDVREPEVVYVAPPRVRHHHGRWEWQKTWVPPVYERVWNPGHYDRRGRWIPGAWIELKKADGYWHQERVWIADNHYRPY